MHLWSAHWRGRDDSMRWVWGESSVLSWIYTHKNQALFSSHSNVYFFWIGMAALLLRRSDEKSGQERLSLRNLWASRQDWKGMFVVCVVSVALFILKNPNIFSCRKLLSLRTMSSPRRPRRGALISRLWLTETRLLHWVRFINWLIDQIICVCVCVCEKGELIVPIFYAQGIACTCPPKRPTNRQTFAVSIK